MKKILFYLFFSFIIFGFISCNNDDNDYNEPYKSEYMIKYYFKCSVDDPNIILNVGYITNIKNQIYNTYYIGDKYCEQIANYLGSYDYEDEIECGPFEYNSTVEFKIYKGHPNIKNNILKIYISKNGSPYILKQMSTDSSVKYIIDY